MMQRLAPAVALFSLLITTIFAGEILYLIDEFGESSINPLVVTPKLPRGAPPQTSNFYSITSPCFSNERDISVTLEIGGRSSMISSMISNNKFFASSQDGYGYSLLQYDGEDHDCELDPSGAFNHTFSDITQEGKANSFYLVLQSDQETSVEIYVYSGLEYHFCVSKISIPASLSASPFFVKFDDFQQRGKGCDFSRVGALEILINLLPNSNMTISLVAAYNIDQSDLDQFISELG